MSIRNRKSRKKTVLYIISAIILFIAAAICIILPPGSGRLPLFYDENKDVIPGSISERAYVEVDGTELAVLITGKDETKPVLLFLSGGPGIPEYLLEYNFPTGLAEEFVVCYLEYRGTSLSYYRDMDSKAMTTERYLTDVAAVTEYLKERFAQEKIFLMGHSFGTFIGIQAAYEFPELYHAYIAMSQLTDQKESEKIAYEYMIEQYRIKGNAKMVAEFEKFPILSSDDIYQKYFVSGLRDKAMHDLGIGTTRNMKSVITGIFLPSLKCPAYSPSERIRIWSGKSFISSAPVGIERTQFNAFNEIPALSIPIYFLGGRYDYTCSYELQKDYFMSLNAPLKGFYTFENSAHSPLFEEPEKAIEILVSDVLGGSSTLLD